MKTILFALALSLAPLAPAFSMTPVESSLVYKSDYTGDSPMFTIAARDADRVELIVDKNKCSLTELGLPAGCTRMAVFSSTHDLEFVAVPADRRTSVYRLKGSEYGIVKTFVGQGVAPSTIRLLKYDSEGRVIRAYTLTLKQR